MNRGTPKVSLASLINLQKKMKAPADFRFQFKATAGKPNKALVERALSKLYGTLATETVDSAALQQGLAAIPWLTKAEKSYAELSADSYWDYRADLKKIAEAAKTQGT